MSFEQCTNVSSSGTNRRRSSPCSERVWEVAASTTSFGFHGHTILQEQWAAEIYDEIGQRSLERLFPGLTEDSMMQATLSAGQSGIGYKRARDIAALAHLGALIAAKPRTQANDSRRSPGRPSTRAPPWRLALPRSSTQPPPPISAPLMTKIKPRRSCMCRRRPRQRKKRGSKHLEAYGDPASQTRQSHRLNTPALSLRMKTVRTWTSQRLRRADSVRRSSKGGFRDSLIGLVSGWQQVTKKFFQGIHDRFIRDETFRNRMIEHGSRRKMLVDNGMLLRTKIILTI